MHLLDKTTETVPPLTPPYRAQVDVAGTFGGVLFSNGVVMLDHSVRAYPGDVLLIKQTLNTPR